MNLDNVTPRPTAHDVLNAWRRHPNAVRDVLEYEAFRPQTPNHADIILGQSRVRVALAAMRTGTTLGPVIGTGLNTMATLGVHVRDVVLLRTQEQMLRANARRSVAAMQNAHALGDRAVGQLPRNTVGFLDHTPSNPDRGVASTHWRSPYETITVRANHASQTFAHGTGHWTLGHGGTS